MHYMKKKSIILFFLLLIPKLFIGQTLTEKKDSTQRFYIGFNAGSIFSKFYAGSIEPGPFDTIFYENTYRPGFTAGFFVNPQSRHFSVRLGLTYTWTKHDISYKESSISPGCGSYTTADYCLYSSALKISFLPTITYGNNIKYYFFIGPDFVQPIYTKIKGQIHETGWGGTSNYDLYTYDNNIKQSINVTSYIITGIGLKKSLNRNNIGVEFILGHSMQDIIGSPSMKENFGIISIVYFLGLK